MYPHHAVLILFALALAGIIASHLVLRWRARLIVKRALLASEPKPAVEPRPLPRPGAVLPS
ncbi:MAG: hypothetical protein JSR82_18145 [Verrucomicrobia bacterium]|nr:hypothetical protein [Verrucomicrobiota bacterium]